MTTDQSAKVFCTTTLNYIGKAEGGPGQLEVPVLDGRTATLPGWEECGFELMRHASAVTSWDDNDEIARAHYPEISQFAKQLTGCDYALVGGHIKRNPEEAKKHAQLSPIKFVHSDFADSYGETIRALYRSGQRQETAEAAGLSPDDVIGAKRLMILQFWRNIGPAKMDFPLAFCDARDVPREQTRAFPVKNYAGSGFDFEALAILGPANPSDHHWYVFPEMQPHEVVTFRTWDSALVGTDKPYWTPHGAVRDPEVEEGKPARSSIEMRATCLWL